MIGEQMETKIGFIAVELSNDDAEKFKCFLKYYDKIKFLIGENALDLQRGYVTINYDNNGNISSIQKCQYIYPKKNEKK